MSKEWTKGDPSEAEGRGLVGPEAAGNEGGAAGGSLRGRGGLLAACAYGGRDLGRRQQQRDRITYVEQVAVVSDELGAR